MGKSNFVIEGVSGSGKTTVCEELAKRGYHAVHGDRSLRPPKTQQVFQGRQKPDLRDEADIAAWVHQNAIWDKSKVMPHLENHDVDVTFFCGGF